MSAGTNLGVMATTKQGTNTPTIWGALESLLSGCLLPAAGATLDNEAFGQAGVPGGSSASTPPDSIGPRGRELEDGSQIEVPRFASMVRSPGLSQGAYSGSSEVPTPHKYADPRVRNVIVFGESGVGKSSLINVVADMPTAGTSSDSVGCTLRYEPYLSTIEGETFNLWDTVGLDEGTFGTVPAAMAEGQLKTFLRRLTAASGIDLVIYCVRGTRARKALLHNYRILCSIIDRKKVPVVLVVTGLENYEGKMEDWWARNEQELKHYGMCFDGHACVTTLNVKMVKDAILRDRCEESRRIVRDLIRKNRRSDSWSENAGLPTVVIYDPTVSVLRTQHRPGCSDVLQSHPLPMNKRLHHFQPVSPLPHRQERSFKADLLVFYVEARSYDYHAAQGLLRPFRSLNGGDTVPLIIVVKGLSNEESLDHWRKNHQQAEGTAVTFTYWPSPESGERCREEADQRFQQLVERHCCAKDIGLGEQTRRYFNLIFAGAGAVVGVIQWEKFFHRTLGGRFLNIESLP